MALFKGKEDGAGAMDFSWAHAGAASEGDPAKDIMERYGKIQSALGPGTRIEGKLTFDKPVRIDGELKGEVLAPDAVVVIGSGAKIDAQMEAGVLVIMGEVKGAVRALKRVELLAGGMVTGDIETRELVIEQGSFFNGSCKMPETAASPKAADSKQGGADAGKRDHEQDRSKNSKNEQRANNPAAQK